MGRFGGARHLLAGVRSVIVLSAYRGVLRCRPVVEYGQVVKTGREGEVCTKIKRVQIEWGVMRLCCARMLRMLLLLRQRKACDGR